jgi:hypothetical protein
VDDDEVKKVQGSRFKVQGSKFKVNGQEASHAPWLSPFSLTLNLEP